MQKEINKLLKRINVEKLKNNHKECIELYNIIGGLYSDIGSYEEAVFYHEQALDICKTIGDRLSTAMALRYIGESKASLGEFYQAIDYIKKYLELAQKLKNKVEIQRAWTTLGRVYLMQAQDMKENCKIIDDQIKDTAQEAEKRFQTALNLAESVRDQVDEKEFAQMSSGLLLNIGLIKDICGQHGETVLKLNRAIEICRNAKLKEDLYRCQIILAGIYRQKDNIKMAVKVSEEALVTSKQIGKKLLICDAYIERGLVKIYQRDFKGAKRTFAQAYLEKSPNEEDHSKAIRLTKLSHLISEAYDKIAQDNTPSETRMKLCDKLGDMFVAVGAYKLAVEFYKRAFSEAKICSRPKSELGKILFSVAESYADCGQFEHALVCYEKEINYRNGDDSEQCQSLIKIAQMHEYLNHDLEKVSQAYEKALEKARKNPKLIYKVLKDYLQFTKKKSLDAARHRELENIFSNLKSYPEVIEEIERGDEEEVNDIEDEIANIDDIITDDEDNDEVLMVGRRRAKGNKRFKANEVGDTPLHEACIKGDLKRVKSLISQGHEVNPRDNAGWIPLHEACNHGHYEIADFLVENGADVSNRGLKGMSPLHDAATNGHYEIMRLLIKNGANVIALTDSGETVLSCLRDYKKRNYSSMSNRDLSEYKQMEAELLNMMDKCGFNLMEENMKNLGTRLKNRGDSVENCVVNSQSVCETVRARPMSSRTALDSNPISNTVRDYKSVIGTLKRKKINACERENYEKANLPATYHTGSNTSAPTKEWLIDDVSRDKKVSRSGLEETIDLEDDEFSDDDLNFEKVSTLQPTQSNSHLTKKSSLQSAPSTSCTAKSDPKKFVLDSDDENEFDDIIVINDENGEPTNDKAPSSIEDNLRLCSPNLGVRSESSMNISMNSYSKSRPFNLFEDPLVVIIEDRKLLIPIKDEYANIKWLKESIVERYAALIGAMPVIKLSPISDPSCIFFDNDSCCDVIRENVLATVDSWQLESIEQSYVSNCSRLELNALDFVKMELRRVEEMGNKLDLSYIRFPRTHLKPIAMAIARRDFTSANMTGFAGLLDSPSDGEEILEVIGSWKKLNQLSLRCVGLKRCHLETISTKFKLPELKSLDVSFNSIAYKCKLEFKRHMESLVLACPSLKRLDMRKNHLQFVKSICEPSSELNLSKILDIMAPKKSGDLEILGSDQKEYSVYLV